MTGGEKDLQQLKNTYFWKNNNHSFPLEEEEEMIKEDFEKMGINYSQLPDLHVGDGEIQVVVANADLPKVESWYKLYREDLLKKGMTDVPAMKKCRWTIICRQDSRPNQSILIRLLLN